MAFGSYVSGRQSLQVEAESDQRLTPGRTTFILALYNVRARGVVIPNVVLGMLLGQGGLVMLLAGMWEFATGNTFAATSISSYAAFFMSFGVLYSEQSTSSRRVWG